MLLGEQVRQIVDEIAHANDTAHYDSASAVHDWQTRVSKTVTLTKTSLVFVSWDTYAHNGYGAGRLLIDSVPVASSGAVELGVTTTRRLMLLLAAGTYTFTFQSSMDTVGSPGYIRIENVVIGSFVFSDMTGDTLDGGAVSCGNAATTTLLNEDITVPETRNLAVGTIKKYVVFVVFYMTNTYQRLDYVKDAADSNTASAFNFKIFWDDVQGDWTEKANDVLTTSVNPTYGIGAHGIAVLSLDADQVKNLKVKVYQSTGATRSCRVYARVFVCPWVFPLSGTFEPLTLDFPPQSTLYVTTEPLGVDSNKDIKLGRGRGVSFGDSTDYYDTNGPTAGIVMYDYTFQSIKVSDMCLFFDGLYTCISYAGVDLR